MGVSIRRRKDRRGTHYQAVADFGPDPQTGRRRQRTKECKSKKEAQEVAAQWLLELKQGIAVAHSDWTVAQLMTYWLQTHASTRSAKTYEDYERTVRVHVLPHLGEVKLQQLRPDQVVSWLIALRQENRGRRTIEVAHARLSQALKQAVTLGLVARNVAALVKPPATDEREKATQTWTEEDAQRFLQIAEQRSGYGPIWRVSLATGMRRGELLGLRWQDVDWEKQLLRVRQSVGIVNGTVTIGPPKTKTSIRDVHVEDDLLEDLRKHRARQDERRRALGETWHDHDLVFASEIGTPVNPNNLYRSYNQLVALAGVSRIRIHDQRHTHASWAIEEGIDPKTVAERLGHDVTMTLGRYTHISEKTHRAAAQRLSGKIKRRPAKDEGLDEHTSQDAPPKRDGDD